MASWYATSFITIIGFKQVAVDVERDEDESGTFGETFIDYVRVYVSFIFMKRRESSFVLPRSLPVFTSIVALRNLHIPILFPETSQAISWSSSSWPSGRNILLVSSATSWTYLQVEYHERIGWKQCIIFLTDWNNSVCLSGQLSLHCWSSPFSWSFVCTCISFSSKFTFLYGRGIFIIFQLELEQVSSSEMELVLVKDVPLLDWSGKIGSWEGIKLCKNFCKKRNSVTTYPFFFSVLALFIACLHF